MQCYHISYEAVYIFSPISYITKLYFLFLLTNTDYQ
jgi:hypothetical protein